MSRLADVGRKGGGVEGLSESVLRKENLRRKNFFQIMLNEVLKSCDKRYLLDVKTNKKNKKGLGA